MTDGGVAIVGAGMVRFGEHFDRSFEQLTSDAIGNAFESVDAGIDPGDLEAAWLGTVEGELGLGRESVTGATLTEVLGRPEIPATRVENACATGSDALRNAVFGIASGAYDVALVVGADKLREADTDAFLAHVADRPHYRGMTAPAFFAMYANRHMERFGTTSEDLADVAVKNHAHGARCEHSHFQFEIDREDVFASPEVASPFHLLDCCPQTDGAAALVLTSADVAPEYTADPVYVRGTGLGTDTYHLEHRPDFLEAKATVRAAEEAYEMAGVGPADVDVVELHDCFTFTEILNYEDLGFAEKGEGRRLIAEGRTALDGSLPVNPSGGLKAKGHPIGATGVAQVVELFWQLRGEADGRQVGDANVALQHNIGGPLAVACVTILADEPA